MFFHIKVFIGKLYKIDDIIIILNRIDRPSDVRCVAIGSTVNILTNKNTETLINQSQFAGSSYKVVQVVVMLLPLSIRRPRTKVTKPIFCKNQII